MRVRCVEAISDAGRVLAPTRLLEPTVLSIRIDNIDTPQHVVAVIETVIGVRRFLSTVSAIYRVIISILVRAITHEKDENAIVVMSVAVVPSVPNPIVVVSHPTLTVSNPMATAILILTVVFSGVSNPTTAKKVGKMAGIEISVLPVVRADITTISVTKPIGEDLFMVVAKKEPQLLVQIMEIRHVEELPLSTTV